MKLIVCLEQMCQILTFIKIEKIGTEDKPLYL